MNLIWLAGVPGSSWSGIDNYLRHCLDADRTDETSDRRFFHRNADPHLNLNGHRGSYWGEGMGCGENWKDLSIFNKQKIYDDINEVFLGEGLRIIKMHGLARYQNLDYIWQNFKNDWLILVWKDDQESIEWWNSTMNFENSYPDYKKMYVNSLTLEQCIKIENKNILDFAQQKKLTWKKIDRELSCFNDLPSFALTDEVRDHIANRWKNKDGVFISVSKIV